MPAALGGEGVDACLVACDGDGACGNLAWTGVARVVKLWVQAVEVGESGGEPDSGDGVFRGAVECGEFGDGEVFRGCERRKVGAVVAAVGNGDVDGAAYGRGVVSRLVGMEGGQVVEDFLAMDGVEMDGDGVEGRDDIDDLRDGVEFQEPTEAEDEREFFIRRWQVGLEQP